MLTTNQPGVLARVAHMFCRRSYNLLSVCAEKARIFDQYCITVAVQCDERTLEHPEVAALYPAGEGAGYAGGIVSAALDGMRCAEAAAARWRQP